MQESWHRYLRLGIVHFMAFPQTVRGDGPIVETLKQIAGDEFFTAVELGWVNDAKERAAAAALLRDCLLYTSDAADDMQCVDLGGRRKI